MCNRCCAWLSSLCSSNSVQPAETGRSVVPPSPPVMAGIGERVQRVVEDVLPGEVPSERDPLSLREGLVVIVVPPVEQRGEASVFGEEVLLSGDSSGVPSLHLPDSQSNPSLPRNLGVVQPSYENRVVNAKPSFVMRGPGGERYVTGERRNAMVMGSRIPYVRAPVRGSRPQFTSTIEVSPIVWGRAAEQARIRNIMTTEISASAKSSIEKMRDMKMHELFSPVDWEKKPEFQ